MKKKRTKSAAARRPKSPSLLTLFPDCLKKAYTAKDAENVEPVIRDLRECYLHRGLVLYLGSGVSRSVGLPNWQELVRSLTVTMMSQKVTNAFGALGKPEDEKFWSTLSAIHEDVEKGADYGKPILMMARAIKDELGSDLQWIVTRNLARHFRRHRAPTVQRLPRGRVRFMHSKANQRSELLDAIVALARSERDVKGVQAIINYNYDDIVDETLRAEHVQCTTVRSGKDKVETAMLPCYHVHGVLPVYKTSRNPFREASAHMNAGNFVFSEDEYHVEYMDPYRWSNMTQMSNLGRHSGLFIGLSMEDPNIRRLLDVTHRQYPDMQHYAILTRKVSLRDSTDSKNSVLRNLFEQVEANSFKKIGVNVIWVDSHDLVPGILNKICTTCI